LIAFMIPAFMIPAFMIPAFMIPALMIIAVAGSNELASQEVLNAVRSQNKTL
jgi:hypothetical protein